MSCSKRPKPSSPDGEGPAPLGITYSVADGPVLLPEELKRRIRLLAGALVEVWIESAGLEELQEEARNARAKRRS